MHTTVLKSKPSSKSRRHVVDRYTGRVGTLQSLQPRRVLLGRRLAELIWGKIVGFDGLIRWQQDAVISHKIVHGFLILELATSRAFWILIDRVPRTRLR